MRKIPFKIPSPEEFNQKQILSYLSYAMGVTEKPGPFAALSVGNRFLGVVEVLVEEGRRNLLGYWVKELSPPQDLPEGARQKTLREMAVAFLKDIPLTAQKIHLGFTDDFVPLRKVTVPEMPKEEVPQAIRWAVRTQLPFEAEKSLLEFDVVNVASKKQDVVLVACREAFLTDWVVALQEAGFRVASISSNILSLLSWMKEGGAFTGLGPVAWLDIGSHHTFLYIVSGGKIGFIRDLEIGGDTMTQALTRPLATEQGELKLSVQEAETLKRNYGFPLGEQIQGERVNASQMVSLMRPLLERLASEVRRSLDYYQTEFGGHEVQKIYLSGGSSQLKHLAEFLTEKLLLPVDRPPFPSGFQWTSSKINEKNLHQQFPILSHALALAFQEGKELNLLPQRFRTPKSQKIERIAMRMSSVVIFFVLLTLSLYKGMEVRSLKRELDASQTTGSTIQGIESMRETVAEQKGVLSRIERGHPYLLEALGEIANLLPPHAVLNRISHPRGTDRLSFSGTIFGLQDQPTEGLLGELISGFEKSPFFKEVKLVASQRDETYDRPASNFEILCRMKVR